MQSRGGLKGHQFCRSACSMIGWRGRSGSNPTSKVSGQTRTDDLLPETEAQEDLLLASKNSRQQNNCVD